MLIRTIQSVLCLFIAIQINATPGRRKGALQDPPVVNSWPDKWFPFAPGKEPKATATPHAPPTIHAVVDDKPTSRRKGQLNQPYETESWSGKWFPFVKGSEPETITIEKKQQPVVAENKIVKDDLTMKWFPFKPVNATVNEVKPLCDDGQHSIEIDFDPNNKQHALKYLCLTSNRSLFEPNLSLKAILEEQFIPPAFVPPVKCLNESILYEISPNTFGAFRPAPPNYGTYVYLPEQRWLHSLIKGAIVMLYHPCAFPAQVKILRDTLQSCLYRHIITPSQALDPERPLALLAWGKMLRMSVVDERLVVDFIKKYAKQGPAPMTTDFGSKASYAVGLVQEAKLITDIDDSEICGYKEM